MEPRSDNDRILGFVEDGPDTHVAPYAVGLRVLHERTGPSMYRLSTGVDQLLRRVVWRRRHSTDSWPRRSSTFERPNRARRCTSPTAYKTPPVAGCFTKSTPTAPPSRPTKKQCTSGIS